MKITLRFFSICVALATSTFWMSSAPAQSTTSTATTPAAAAAEFKAVTSKLDFGGTALTYTSYQGGINNLFSIFDPLLQVHPQVHSLGVMAKSALLKLGLNNVSLGSSVLPLEDGREVRKIYIRAKGRPGIFALAGAQSTSAPLQSLTHIPSDATAAWCGRFEFAELLPLINSIAEGAMGPVGKNMVADLVTKTNKALAVDLEKLLASLGDEYAFHVIKGNQTDGKAVPVMTFRLAAKNDSLYQAARKLLGKAAKVEDMPDQDSTRLTRLSFASGDDARIFYLAYQPDWLVVSTKVEEIKRTTHLADGDSLLSNVELKKSAPSLPANIDALSFVSKAYADENLSSIQEQVAKFKDSITSGSEDEDSSSQIAKATFEKMPQVVENLGLAAPYTGWRVNDPDGILFTEIGSPRHIPSTTMMATGGIVVAIAVPAFLRARENARGRACQENLVRIDGAKEQYALEYKKSLGDSVTMDDLKPYLTKVPQCPAGGEYSLNPIGSDPTCSIGDDVPEGAPPHVLNADK